MKKIVLLIIAAVLSTFLSVNAQSSFGVFAEGGTSYIKITDGQMPSVNLQVSQHALPSANAGVYYKGIVKKRVAFGIKHFIGYGAIKSEYTYANPNVSWQEGIRDVSVFALGFNPTVGFVHEKVSLNAGVQLLNYFWNNSSEKTTYYQSGFYSGGNYYPARMNYMEYENKGEVFILDYGITASVEYEVNKRVLLSGTYYMGHKVFKFPMGDGFYQTRQLTMGIKYVIAVSKKREREK